MASKRNKLFSEKVDKTRLYPLDEALGLLKELANAKFAESIDVSVNLGVDPRKSDQVVRGSTVLPNGTGKSVRVAVFAQGANAEAATEPAPIWWASKIWLSRSRAETSISTWSSPRRTRCVWSDRWVRFSARAG